jgi:N-acetylmuramoyl-L-alanine amidase
MRDIKKIIIHCADTYAEMDIGVAEIRRWHIDRGWADIGYHFVIRRNGDIEKGRDEETPGAHVKGHNHDSIGVCLVGGKPFCNFTRAQWHALESLVMELKGRYPLAAVSGHRDHDPSKTCPTFDVRAWLA